MRSIYKHTLLACYLGYITQAIVNNLAPLLFVIFQTEYKLSFEMIGRLILLNFCVQIGADFLSMKYVDRIGYRKSAVIAHAFSAAGLIGLGILPKVLPDPYLGLCAAVVLYAMGGGIIEVIISPIVDSLPGEEKESAMSLLHSFYCWGQVGVVVITTLLLQWIGGGFWFLLPCIWAILPLYNLFKFLRVPLRRTVSEEERTSLKHLFSSRGFLIALVLMMCAGASELSMSQWSSIFAEKGLRVPKVMGDLLGPCMFAFLMGIGRTIYGILGSRMPLKPSLAVSGLLCVISYLLTVLAGNPYVSLFGCALCGFSVALMWPGTFSLTAAAFPKGGTAMFALLAVMGDIGCAVGPWITGVVSDFVLSLEQMVEFGARNGLDADQLGLKSGLLVAGFFPLILLLGVFLLKKNPQHAK